MMLFPEALLFATCFPNLDKTSIFPNNPNQQISKNYENFPKIFIFHSKSRENNVGFRKVC